MEILENYNLCMNNVNMHGLCVLCVKCKLDSRQNLHSSLRYTSNCILLVIFWYFFKKNFLFILVVARLQTARVATHVEREKLPTLEFHMGCQQRCHMDITDMDTDMATMDMLDIIPCFQAGQGTTHTHQIPSQEQIKDSSASEDDHPEPKS
jgi:hypothetical protein